MKATQILDVVRGGKHRAFVLWKRLSRARSKSMYSLRAKFLSPQEFNFDLDRYYVPLPPSGTGAQVKPLASTFPVNHLAFEVGDALTDPQPAPEVIFAIWLGGPLPEKRHSALEVIRSRNPDLRVQLVTADNLENFVLKSAPLHPLFSSLAPIHQSDYLRAYLMHHYGGAYVDLKPVLGSFRVLLERINASSAIWGGGMPEGLHNLSPAFGQRMAKDQERYLPFIPAQSCFAYKPGTPFTGEWLAEVERRLDYFSSILKRHPGRDPFGADIGYPIPHFALLVHVYNPLALKYLPRMIVSEQLRYPPLELQDYR